MVPSGNFPLHELVRGKYLDNKGGTWLHLVNADPYTGNVENLVHIDGQYQRISDLQECTGKNNQPDV